MLLAVAAVLALQGDDSPEDYPILLGLRCLARHQCESGAWGPSPEGCRCPRDPAPEPPRVDEETRARVARLVAEFRADEVVRRENAEKVLEGMGGPALHGLRQGVEATDPEVAGRCRRLIDRLEIRGQESDLGVTGLALLAFLCSEYTHLSRDTYDGIVFGAVVKKGLMWLMRRQDTSGRYGEGGADNAIAALALSEVYGLTGSGLFKEAAARGVDAVAREKGEDVEFLLWKGMVLKSWELAEGTDSGGTLREISRALADREGPVALSGCVLLAAFTGKKGEEDRLERLCRIDPSSPDMKVGYFAHLALMEGERRPHKLWRERAALVSRHLVSDQRFRPGTCDRGSWGGPRFRGRLASTAFAVMAVAIHPYHGGVFR